MPWPLGIGIGIKLVGLLLGGGGAVEISILMSFHGIFPLKMSSLQPK